MKTFTNPDLKNYVQSGLKNFNLITAEDLKELEKAKKQKIIFTEDFGKYKVGDILDIKVFSNTHTSEPPSFFVVDEKLGSFKYGFGGRGFKPFFKEYQDKPKGIKAIFKNDYIWKSGQKCAVGMLGCAPETITYKKGDSLAGLSLSLSSDKKQVVSYMGNYTVRIPVENLQLLNDDGTPIESPTADVLPQTFIQKHKNHLLIAGALVLGYFAYKKFNK